MYTHSAARVRSPRTHRRAADGGSAPFLRGVRLAQTTACSFLCGDSTRLLKVSLTFSSPSQGGGKALPSTSGQRSRVGGVIRYTTSKATLNGSWPSPLSFLGPRTDAATLGPPCPPLMDVAFNDNGGDLLAGGTRYFVFQLCRWALEQAACFQEGGVRLLLQGWNQPFTHPPDPTLV